MSNLATHLLLGCLAVFAYPLITVQNAAATVERNRLVMLEAFRDFVRDRLLENTKRFVGLNEFNRHGILHGLFDDFGQAINFLRLITLLDLLCFCIGMTEGVSMFAPGNSPESAALAALYRDLHPFHSRREV